MEKITNIQMIESLMDLMNTMDKIEVMSNEISFSIVLSLSIKEAEKIRGYVEDSGFSCSYKREGAYRTVFSVWK